MIDMNYLNSQIMNKQQECPTQWIKYIHSEEQNRPEKYGKHFVHRKDGKMHYETWNGTGWAYNGNVITHFMVIVPPK
jgi:hypothetical protein